MSFLSKEECPQKQENRKKESRTEDKQMGESMKVDRRRSNGLVREGRCSSVCYVRVLQAGEKDGNEMKAMTGYERQQKRGDYFLYNVLCQLT